MLILIRLSVYSYLFLRHEDLSNNLIELLKELSKAKVKFVVCGGVACVLYGVERATYDIDLSVSFEKSNLEKIVEVVKNFDLKPRIPEPVENLFDEKKRMEWFTKKGALEYTFVSGSSPLQLDIFLSYPVSYEKLLSNSNEIIIDDLKLSVSSIKDLLYVKNLINPKRDKDLTDIKELTGIINERPEKDKSC